MQPIEKGAPAANARYASRVITEAADIIDEATKRVEQCTVYDALKQATDEYRAEEAESNETKRSYGMVALIKDIGKYVKEHPSATDVHFPDDWEPVSRWSNSTDPETVTATLREAAPAIAEHVRAWTARVEANRRKVQALNLSEEDVLEEVRKVRGK
jgi:hypothetical protein